MGAAKRRREAFFAEHPNCCFCGGEEPATTVDHIPARSTFIGGIGPDGFEFPACGLCNSSTSGSEQVFALYARLFDRNTENYDQAHSLRLINGVRNNYPAMLPDASISANEKRRVLRHWGVELPRGTFLDDVPLAAFPKSATVHLQVTTLKILAALYYRHLGRPLGFEDGVFWGWSQQGLPGTSEAMNELFEGMPSLVVGGRVNTDIGDQFAYRWGTNEEVGLFGLAAGFGAGIFLMAASAPWKMVKEVDKWHQFEPQRSPPRET